MLCKTCQEMLCRRKGRRGSSTTLQVSYDHHKYHSHLRNSAGITGCYICRVVLERLQLDNKQAQKVADGADERKYLSASLRRVPGRDSMYRLDFRLHESKLVASFILLGNDETSLNQARPRPISSNTSDPEVLALAKQWISECESTHPNCHTPTGTSFYPTRLIEVASSSGKCDDEEKVRVVSSRPEEHRSDQPDFEGPYVTLSHCWGSATFLKLKRENLKLLQNDIHLDDLPLTFRHAIKLARKLDVRWIWIDALCIVQDNKEDWLRESSTMNLVYSHSYCNISATAAEDSSKGLFNPRDESREWVQTVTVKVEGLGGDAQDVRCTILDLSFWERYVEQAPANKRSWILQERLLSPRVLHWCQDQIAFECRQIDRAECRPQGLPNFLEMRGELVDGARFKRVDQEAGKELRQIRLTKEVSSSNQRKLREMVAQADPRSHYYEIWKRVVEIYTKMQLTNAEDRLIALSGIARMMRGRMEAEGITDEYIAGLWQHGLASQLLWYVNETKGSDPQPFRDNRPKTPNGAHFYRAPSFSWASIESSRGITFGEITETGLRISVEVVRLMYRTEKDNFGIITDGYIVLRGTLRRVLLVDKQAYTEPTQAPRAVYLAHHMSQLAESFIGTPQAIDLDPPRLKVYLGSQLCFLLCTFAWHFYVLSPTNRNILPTFLFWIIFSIKLLRPAFIKPKKDTKPPNRWSWRLMHDGMPQGRKYTVVWLDSPASNPTVFGPDGQVFVIPALQTKRHLWCLMVQATYGDYGVRYRRIGITQISTTHEQEVRDIITPPGNNKVITGRYYWIEGQKTGESTICII